MKQNPVWRFLDRPATTAALERFSVISMTGRRELYGVLTAALWSADAQQLSNARSSLPESELTMNSRSSTISQCGRRVVLAAASVLITLTAVAVPVDAAPPPVTFVGESQVASNATTTALNGRSFQQDAVATENGHQYAAYYSEAQPGTRHVTVARRDLSSLGGEWERAELADYDQGVDDSHRIVSLGVSPSDGTIHLAFDTHATGLRYRRSAKGLTTDPPAHPWAADWFGPTVSNSLGGLAIPTEVTYPRFVTTPQGNLVLSFSVGTAGARDEYLFEYRGATGTWTAIGKFIEGTASTPTVGAYLNGLDYDRTGRLHATWTWRGTPSSVSTNYDLMYAYSDDDGRTWRNNEGVWVGVSGAAPMSPSSTGVQVWEIPQNSGLLNSEAQTVDVAGRVHVMMRDNLSGNMRFVHYFRRVSDGQWQRRVTPIPAPLTMGRPKLVTDEAQNVYALLPGLRIASAPVPGYNDWALVSRDSDGRFGTEPLVDRQLGAMGEGVAVFLQESGSRRLVVQEWCFCVVVEPGFSTVTEGDEGTQRAEFSVTLSAPNSTGVAVEYETIEPAGQAQIPDDLEDGQGTLRFQPGETSKTSVLTIKGDTVCEAEETAVVAFSGPENGRLGGVFGLGGVRILDDDC